VGERRGFFPPALRDHNGYRLHGSRRRAHPQKVKLGRPPEPGRRGLSNDQHDRDVVGYYVVLGSTRYPGSASSAPNATTSASVAERTTSPRAYILTAL
jgi:hypothetical protein